MLHVAAWVISRSSVGDLTLQHEALRCSTTRPSEDAIASEFCYVAAPSKPRRDVGNEAQSFGKPISSLIQELPIKWGF